MNPTFSKETKIPSREECFQLFKEHKLTYSLMNHSFRVNQIAMFIGEKLIKKGIPINLELLDRATLLHDLIKGCNIHPEEFITEDEPEEVRTFQKEIYEKYNHLHHADAIEEILPQYPELCKIIKAHNPISAKLETWEEKLMTYADLKCNSRFIISLKEREANLKERYTDFLKANPKFRQAQEERIAFCDTFEQELLIMLELTQEDLLKLNEKPLNTKP
jgi:5'-deoxynucleotidase YfbR-like HD superfamily hydrolase